MRGPIAVALLAAGAYALLLHQRGGLVDFAVLYTAADRAMDAEPLYRPDDGHFQFKCLPAFALVMAPFAPLPKAVAEALWFGLTAVMAWAFVRVSLRALPDRRTAANRLVWLTLLVNGKFLVKELAFGQFNLPIGLLLMGALLAARRQRSGLAGALTGASIFIKPYGLILMPWLLWTHGWRPLPPFAAAVAIGLLLPAGVYGWGGNLALLQDWYRTVTETTAPNLLSPENISFASMWTRWMRAGPAASALALATTAAALGLGAALVAVRRRAATPDYLECAYLFLLIPLISPQGWDYVLLLALPAYMYLIDRWGDLEPRWRVVAATGIALTSFTIFDLLRRPLYTLLMEWSAASVGAVLIALALARLRWQGDGGVFHRT